MLVSYEDFEKGWDIENLPEESKIMISLPMRGIDDLTIKKNMNYIFTSFCRSIKRDDLVLIDTFIKAVPKNIANEAVWCLGDSIKLMSTVGLVIFSEDYWKARGCLVELDICREYHIPFAYESAFNLSNTLKQNLR